MPKLPPSSPNEIDNSESAAKALDDPQSNPQHLGNLPRGFTRSEEAKRREDELAEKLAADAENGGSLSSDALKPEREILHYLDPQDGNWPISNRRPERHYVGVHKDNITIAQYRTRGYQMVQGDDQEAIEFKGLDAAGGSSLRGLGDCLLMWCPVELRDKWEEQNIRKAIAVGALTIEEGPEPAWADTVNDPRSMTRKLGAMAHARHNDPKMQSTIFRGTAGQIERLAQGIRDGTVPNFEQHMMRP